VSIFRPTDPPHPFSSEKGCPTGRPSRPLATPREPDSGDPTDRLSPAALWLGRTPQTGPLRSRPGTQRLLSTSLRQPAWRCLPSISWQA